MEDTVGAKRKTRVLLVDDSPLALVLLKRMVASAPDLEVVGAAKDGREALELIPGANPDVVCTDLHMPVMDGLELTREIMRDFPRPILVVSASVSEGNRNVFELIEAGAVDVLPKPKGGGEEEFAAQAGDLIGKIRILSGVRVFRRRKKGAEKPKTAPPLEARFPKKPGRFQIVAMGGSTGGPQAFQLILSRFPAGFNLPIVCVQHIGEFFADGLREWLGSVCDLRVEIAKEGAEPTAGVVYFPPGGADLVFDEAGKFKYLYDTPINGHRPSIDLTFGSVAKRFGSGAIGVLLTGMGRDGAEGMREIADAGGMTIAQDEATSIVFGMPKSAVELGAVQSVLPLEEIAPAIMRAVAQNGGTPG
ncbi:MAG: chemotaxis-specific protein-glutamate methyltransferase CheB [Nitrospinae bacterium]|nr:chemotaxis-specific protein-glutamate methyltransferase CheB [Nitrospinota bacterium]